MDDRLREQAPSTGWKMVVTVAEKTMTVSVGDATQSIRWLASAAIAKWDDEDYQGWRKLGIPTLVKLLGSDEGLNLDAGIRDILNNGDHVIVHSSLQPDVIL
jgi:hypothetical protein